MKDFEEERDWRDRRKEEGRMKERLDLTKGSWTVKKATLNCDDRRPDRLLLVT